MSTSENKITQRQIGRLILQFHQVSNFINQFHDKKKPLKFLDVGTGNGILPELVSNIVNQKYLMELILMRMENTKLLGPQELDQN